MKRKLLAMSEQIFLSGLFVTTESPLDSFDVNLNGSVRATAVQTDGKILFGGEFSKVNGKNRNYYERLNPNPTVDTAFSPSPSFQIYSIVMAPKQ